MHVPAQTSLPSAQNAYVGHRRRPHGTWRTTTSSRAVPRAERLYGQDVTSLSMWGRRSNRHGGGCMPCLRGLCSYTCLDFASTSPHLYLLPGTLPWFMPYSVLYLLDINHRGRMAFWADMINMGR